MSMPPKRVIKVLEKVIWLNGKLKNICCDNGSEFIAQVFKDWCKGNEINIMYTQPGKPTQNGYIERFNGSYRRAVLDRYIFRNLSEIRELTEAWRNDYNEERLHEALDNMTPFEYREELIKRKGSSMTDVLTSKGNTSRYSGQGQDEYPCGQSCPLYRLVLEVAYQKSVRHHNIVYINN